MLLVRCLESTDDGRNDSVRPERAAAAHLIPQFKRTAAVHQLQTTFGVRRDDGEIYIMKPMVKPNDSGTPIARHTINNAFKFNKIEHFFPLCRCSLFELPCTSQSCVLILVSCAAGRRTTSYNAVTQRAS
jgi:hypothetical protein